MIANYHAPKEPQVEESIRLLERFGVKNIVKQADVFNPDLFFRLLDLAPIGELGRMTQFKSAESKNQTAHLMMYPVLMVHDVAGYREVLVGEDQQQHLQFARLLLKKYNRTYGQNLAIPKERIVVGRIKDLRNSQNKMSKSSPKGCLFLDDPPDTIRLKLRKAVADEKGLENLRYLHQYFVGSEIPESNLALKEELAEAIIEYLYEQPNTSIYEKGG